MQLELTCHDRAATRNDIQKVAFVASEYQFDVISVLYPYLDTVVDLIGHHTLLASPIDFPFGSNITSIKVQQLSESIKRGVNIADLVINTHHIINKQFNKLVSELEQFNKYCGARGVEPRVIIEYKYLTTKQTVNLCKAIKAKGIYSVITETGNLVDNFEDSIIIAKEIFEETGLKVIIDTNFISVEEFDFCQKIEIAGIRLRRPDMIPKLLRSPLTRN